MAMEEILSGWNILGQPNLFKLKGISHTQKGCHLSISEPSKIIRCSEEMKQISKNRLQEERLSKNEIKLQMANGRLVQNLQTSEVDN